MGWRGAIRSIAAAQRAAGREAGRRHREYEREAKRQAKLEAIDEAADEVEEFESLIEQITSVHRDCSDSWDWQGIFDKPAPIKPKPSSANAGTARQNLEQYSPGFFTKLFGLVEKKRTKLTAAVATAEKLDAEKNAQALAKYLESNSDWVEMHDLARKIIAGDPQALSDAVNELSPVRELSDLGSRIEFTFRDDRVAEVTLYVNGDTVIPSETKSLLQSGKLSVKRMPQGRFHELYQDYVAGAVLRIARELTAFLPIDTVVVTAVGNMLDSASGHMTDQPVLSAIIPKATLTRLNFEALDPSDALRNFNHRMEFRKTKGLSQIEPLNNIEHRR